MKQLEIFYPNYTRKAVTFTIDDGHITYDRMFLDIVRPYGIKGTFNLCAPKEGVSAEEYRELYRGYEIANHTMRHPYAFEDDREYLLTEDAFDSRTADPSRIYRVEGMQGYYLFERGIGRWRKITDAKTYIKGIDECKAALEEIFGEGSVTGFVWPFGQQNSREVFEYVVSQGYYSIRKTGLVGSSTGFSLPEDVMRWSYNANHKTLVDMMEEYESYPDDGELKFFSFGVHAADFERDGTWNLLREFAERFGGRDGEFWYASVREIFAYASATKNIVLEGGELKNLSDMTVYITVDGERVALAAGESVCVE